MIRNLSLQDAEQILALNTMTQLGSTDLESTTSTLYRILQRPDQHHLFGFEIDGQLVGYLHAQIYEMLYSPNVLLDVLSVAIDENYQGNGIGKKLLAAVEQRAMTLGLDGIRINSGYNRGSAHGFYERLGYVSKIDQKRYIKTFTPVAV